VPSRYGGKTAGRFEGGPAIIDSTETADETRALARETVQPRLDFGDIFYQFGDVLPNGAKVLEHWILGLSGHAARIGAAARKKQREHSRIGK
jgi:hypothetical protein